MYVHSFPITFISLNWLIVDFDLVRYTDATYEAHRARRTPFVHPKMEEWTASADDMWKSRVILTVSIPVGQPFL